MNPKKPRTPCLNCGTEPAEHIQIYCSNRCQRNFETKRRIDSWLRGEYNPSAIAGELRKFVIHIHDGKCARCGWSEIHPVTGNVPVEIDHIDGDHKNNLIDNIRLLCPNCHSLTPTFRALNKGNGRESRRAGLA